MVTSFINVRLLAIISIILALGVTAVVATQTAKPNLGKLLQVAGNVTVNGTPRNFRRHRFFRQHDYNRRRGRAP